jgi:endonuclease YncB( thermonuclease family)
MMQRGRQNHHRTPRKRGRSSAAGPRRYVFPVLALSIGVIAVAVSVQGRPASVPEPPRAALSEGAAAAGDTPAVPLTSGGVTVVDGDTIRLRSEPASIRLVGYNAPETRNARCPEERQLGDRAKRRLRELVASSRLDFVRIACACSPGTEGTEACNYGRSCGTLRADGNDVGDILISEGLAVGFHCGATRCPPTPRPWCAPDHAPG